MRSSLGASVLLALAVGTSPCHGQAGGAPRPPSPAGTQLPETDSHVRYVLDRIEVRGNTTTSERVVLRFVPFAPGDVLDVDDPKVQLTRYRLLGTGFFRDVNLALVRGTRPGHVALVVEVTERNTLVLHNVWMELAASADTNGEQRLISPFAGVDLAETNLLGTGISLGTTAAFSRDQLGLALRFLDPAFLGGPWMLTGEVLYNDALGFFGNSEVRWDDPQQTSEVTRQAVAHYQRAGGTFGVGYDLTIATQLRLGYRIESIRATLPNAAAHRYGGQLEPIDFQVLPGRSALSSLKSTLLYDSRDQPLLTRQGWLAQSNAEVALPALGSDYTYQRVDLSAAHWWPLAERHVLMARAFAGFIAGSAPFYEQFYIGDLSDFRPGRILGIAFDDRPAPNFFGTSIAEVRYGDYAAKINAEYRFALYRGRRSIYGIDLFTGVGLIGLAGERELRRPPRNLHGAALLPVDFTADLGLRMDTSLGGIALSFAHIVGFIPVGGGN